MSGSGSENKNLSKLGHELCVHNETRYQYHVFLLPWRFRRGQKAASIDGDSHILE